MTWWNGRCRGCETHRTDRWFPLDLERRRKDRMVVLDVRGVVKPVATPRDVDTVVALLEERLRSP